MALRASRPAPIITLGFDVLVHDVMAAITTSPCFSVYSLPLYVKADDLPTSAGERP